MKVTPVSQLGVVEAQALRAWEPTGRVPLVWASDDATGALLMEAIADEAPLSQSGAQVALGEVAALISALHRGGRPAPIGGVTSLVERVAFIFDYWTERYQRDARVSHAVPVERLRRGGERAKILAADGGPSVLLHGDFHPGNVLDGGAARGLVAIDPRPCIGDPAFDAVDWISWNAPNPHAWRARTHELASALSCSEERLWTWYAAFAALFAAGTVARAGSNDETKELLALAP